MPKRYRDNTPLATGPVTLLFTDIEGSTVLWEEDGARMSQALAAHDALARIAVEGHHGTVVKMTGDGMCAAFDEAPDALDATVDLQQALADPAATHGVALRVRCGLHAGVVERRDNDYFGNPVNRAARIMSVAHGGQVLLSQAVVDRMEDIFPAAVSLRDLGWGRLKGQRGGVAVLRTYEEAIAACRETGDREQECWGLIGLANVSMIQDDWDAATERLHCALSLSRDLNDLALEAVVLELMGEVAWARSDLGAAQEHHEHALSILRAMGARTAEADPLRALAKIARARGDFEVARISYLEAFAASREHGEPSYLDEIALMAMALSKPEDAARFAGAADALRHAFGLVNSQQWVHGYREECQSVLGKARYDAAYAAGRALNPEEVVNTTRCWLQNIEGDLASTRSPRASDTK